MWVVVFLMFVGNEYRIQPLPYIYVSKEQCEMARNNNELVLGSQSQRAAFSHITLRRHGYADMSSFARATLLDSR